MTSNGTPHAAFVGLTTLDIAYLVHTYPAEDSKVRAEDQFMAAGGPAANAAVAFSALSDRPSYLITGLGTHFLADIVRADLHACGVTVVDAAPRASGQLPVSSIVVARQSATRTIVSLDGARMTPAFDPSFAFALDPAQILLIDGHYEELAASAAQHARSHSVPVILDAGRWMNSHATLLPLTDVAICSSAFIPPNAGDGTVSSIFEYLHSVGVQYAAITRAADTIAYSTPHSQGTIPVRHVSAIDTLGAGDILHGAFAYYSASGQSFEQALENAATIASDSCQYFGTREWRKHL